MRGGNQKLNQNQNQLNTIFSNLKDTVFVISEDYKVLFKNNTAHEKFGEKITGKVCYEIIKGREKSCDKCPINVFVEKDVCQVSFEQEMKTLFSQEKRYFDIICTPIENYEGQPAILEVLRDITAHKKMEYELEEHRNHLEYMVGERTKELNCLYGLSSIIEEKDISKEEILRRMVELFPPAWQYPEITCARIIVDNQEYKTENFKKTKWKQASDISVDKEKVGSIEIHYLEEKPELDEGPFLKEERDLINAISERLGKDFERLNIEKQLKETNQMLEQRIKERTKDIVNLAKFPSENPNPVLRLTNESVIFTNKAGEQIFNIKGGNKVPALLEEKIILALDTNKANATEIDINNRIYSIDITPISEEGYANVYGRDITERKKAEKISVDLAKFPSENPNAVLRLTKEIIIYTNKKGEKIFDVKEGSKVPVVLQERVIKALDTNKATTIEVEINNRTYSIDITPVSEERYANVYGRDVTKQKEAEKKILDLAKFPSENPNPILRLTKEKVIYVNKEGEKIFNIEEGSNIPVVLEENVISAIDTNKPSTIEIDLNTHIYSIDITPISEEEYANIYGRDITERKKAEEIVLHRARVMKAINNIFQNSFTCENDEEFGIICLEVAQELSGSKFGFFGEVNKQGKFDTIAISNPGWDACKMPDSEDTIIIKGMEIRGMQFLPLKDGKSRIFNDPSIHPDSVGTPKGHPEITCLLSVPFKYKGKIIGQIGLGNKPGGFTHRDQEAIEALSIAMIEALMNRRAEDNLRKSEERFRSIFESKMVGTIFWNAEGDITEANSAFLDMVGYTKDEVLSGIVRWTDMTPPEYLERDEIILKELATNGYISPFEKEYYHKDGRRIPIVLGATTLSGSKVSGVAFVLDITERKKAEAQIKKMMKDLKTSNSELEQFAYVASHDLQEPLRMVASFTQLLQDRYKDKLDDDANDFINYAVDGATRMQNLISDLLIFSRVGSRGKPFKTIDINGVLEVVLNNLRQQINETDSVITNDPLPVIEADESQMIQLFQNLISNAIKFHGDENPRVHISVEMQKNKWIFTVKDNGIGIDTQFFDRIFVIFQRLHKKSEYGGTGIGLAVCKIIIQRHRGKIWVDSELGKGSSFHFSIKKGKQGKNSVSNKKI